MANIWRRTIAGMSLGVFVATAFSLLVTVVRIISGEGPFDALGVSWGQVIALYYVGFVTGGALAGPLEPLRRWVAGSAFVGFVFLLPVYSSFFIVMKDSTTPIGLGVLLVGLVATLTGGGLGVTIWWQDYGRMRDRVGK